MAVPSKKEIEAKQNKLEGYLKQVNEDGTTPEGKILTVVRGAIRKSWMQSPTKLAYWLMGVVPDMDPNTRTKWKCRCEICRGWFKQSDIEIDHKRGKNTFTSVKDFEPYFTSILAVGFDGLQRLCIECHEIKTQCEVMGLDWENYEDWEAGRIEKQVIAICKGSKCPEKKWLINRGIEPETNKTKRRNQVREALVNEHD